MPILNPLQKLDFFNILMKHLRVTVYQFLVNNLKFSVLIKHTVMVRRRLLRVKTMLLFHDINHSVRVNKEVVRIVGKVDIITLFA